MKKQLPVIGKLKRFAVYCLLFTVYCSLFSVVTGCEQSPPPPAPAPQAKKEAPKQAVPAAEVKEEPKKETAVPDVKQKNPFKSFITKEIEKAVVPKTPLQKYELDQLKLIAVMWGMNGSFAMVEAPDGKGFSIKKGDLIGSRGGRVKRIDKDKIIVEERFTEASGETTSAEFEIKLPLPKGEEELR